MPMKGNDTKGVEELVAGAIERGGRVRIERVPDVRKTHELRSYSVSRAEWTTSMTVTVLADSSTK